MHDGLIIVHLIYLILILFKLISLQEVEVVVMEEGEVVEEEAVEVEVAEEVLVVEEASKAHLTEVAGVEVVVEGVAGVVVVEEEGAVVEEE